jgi:hypothetical protein
MDPGPFIALFFATPAIIAAVGAIWLGSRALRIWSKRRGRMYELIDELEGEVAELQERVDSHERLLQQHQDRRRLNSE